MSPEDTRIAANEVQAFRAELASNVETITELLDSLKHSQLRPAEVALILATLNLDRRRLMRQAHAGVARVEALRAAA